MFSVGGARAKRSAKRVVFLGFNGMNVGKNHDVFFFLPRVLGFLGIRWGFRFFFVVRFCLFGVSRRVRFMGNE